MSKKKNYVNNKSLRGELIKHYETGKISDELHFMILKMCERIGTKPNFCNYTYIKDMISDAYLKCINVINNGKFDIQRKNAYGYFTTVIHNCFLDILGKEKRHVNTRDNLKEFVYSEVCSRYPNINEKTILEDPEDN